MEHGNSFCLKIDILFPTNVLLENIQMTHEKHGFESELHGSTDMWMFFNKYLYHFPSFFGFLRCKGLTIWYTSFYIGDLSIGFVAGPGTNPQWLPRRGLSFRGVKSYMWIFDHTGSVSLTLMLFKDQLYLQYEFKTVFFFHLTFCI